jgi:hypothetical protein
VKSGAPIGEFEGGISGEDGAPSREIKAAEAKDKVAIKQPGSHLAKKPCVPPPLPNLKAKGTSGGPVLLCAGFDRGLGQSHHRVSPAARFVALISLTSGAR